MFCEVFLGQGQLLVAFQTSSWLVCSYAVQQPEAHWNVASYRCLDIKG